MIIFKDLLSEKEMFSDAFKMHFEGADDFLICIEGKLKTKKKGESISADLIGGNPSQEEEEEEVCDDTETVTGIDVALDNDLEDVQESLFPTKKDFQNYLKKYVKRVADHMSEKGEKEKFENFKKAMSPTNVKEFLSKFTDGVSVFVHEGFDAEVGNQAPILGVWAEDGQSVKMYAMRPCLCEEKC